MVHYASGSVLRTTRSASRALLSGQTNPVSLRRHGIAEPLRDGVARGLEARPFVSIMEAGNCHQFALVESRQRRIDHVFHGHDDRRGQLLPRKAGDPPEVGRGRARQHRLDADAFISELVLQ